MAYKVIYTADLHGNLEQYKKLINYSNKINAEGIIIGGDIAPKDETEDYIGNQRDFLQNKLPQILKLMKSGRLYLMMGNDDCACNLDVLEKSEHLYKLIHKKRLPLTEDFDIVGYSYVPITPFLIKDWEKYDLSNIPKNSKQDYENRKRINYNFNGVKSTKNRWERFSFAEEMEKSDSIQKDLSRKLFTKKPDKTVYVIHSPPDKTNLDQVKGRRHVGSMAIREFIEKFQPYLTLHAHIHETVDISGNFKDKIMNTLCMSCGNYNTGENLALLEFDLYNLEGVRRRVI